MPCVSCRTIHDWYSSQVFTPWFAPLGSMYLIFNACLNKATELLDDENYTHLYRDNIQGTQRCFYGGIWKMPNSLSLFPATNLATSMPMLLLWDISLTKSSSDVWLLNSHCISLTMILISFTICWIDPSSTSCVVCLPIDTRRIRWLNERMTSSQCVSSLFGSYLFCPSASIYKDIPIIVSTFGSLILQKPSIRKPVTLFCGSINTTTYG